jgi:phage replication-related protein YjqB (UPF0714/DUF867 family)
MTELVAGLPRQGNYSVVTIEDRGSAVKLFAPHGGCIEPCTGPIVSELAGGEFDCYIFRGVMRRDCYATLHVTSVRYDHPDCERMIGRAGAALSVHGCASDAPFIEVGGGNAGLSGRLRDLLRGNGYAIGPGAARLAGADPRNFINRCRLGGVQIELSAGFRKLLFPGFPKELQRHPGEFPRFIAVVRGWLTEVETELSSTLESTT